MAFKKSRLSDRKRLHVHELVDAVVRELAAVTGTFDASKWVSRDSGERPAMEGRAGRHTRDGSVIVLADAKSFDIHEFMNAMVRELSPMPGTFDTTEG